jgi:Tol biopolymer transport system component
MPDVHPSIHNWSWSGDGHYLSIDEGRPPRFNGYRRYTVWSVDELKHIPTILDERPLVGGAWSPQGHTFAAVIESQDGTLELVILSPGDEAEPIVVPTGQRSSVFDFSWSPDGRYFVLRLIDDIGAPLLYDLYSRDGQLIYGGLVGTAYFPAANRQVGFDRWSPDSHLWVYLKERQPRSIDLVGLDVTTGLHKVIASNLASDFASDVFFTTNRYFLDGIDANTVFPPESNRILLPKQREEGLILEVADLDGSNSTILVEDAKDIYYLPTAHMYGNFWSQDGDEVKVLWSAGSDTRLTVAKTDGSDVYTLADDIDAIWFPQDIYTPTGKQWYGFITKRGESFGVEVYEPKTHIHRRLVSGLKAASDLWTITVSPDEIYAAVTVGTFSHQQGNPLLLVPLDGQPARVLHPNIEGEPLWSKNEEYLAYFYQPKPYTFAVEWTTLEGTDLGGTLEQTRLTRVSHLWAWNGCE